jgi:hypothetical protein
MADSETNHHDETPSAGEASQLAIDFYAREKLIPSSEFARLIGISLATEQSMRSRGHTPPYFKRGREIFYAADEVAEWIRANRVEKAPAKYSTGRRSAIRTLLEK